MLLLVAVNDKGHVPVGTDDFGWWGGRDIAAAVSFLARQPGIRRAWRPRPERGKPA